MEKKLKKWMGWPMVAIVVFVFMGMKPSPSASAALPQPHHAYPATLESYGAGKTILAVDYDSVTLRRGDVFYLTFPSNVGQVPASNNAIDVTRIDGETLKFTLSNNCTVGQQITINFLDPVFNFVITVGGDVWPGDANADGLRNMDDLLVIVTGIRNQFQPISTSVTLAYPPNQVEMNRLYAVTDWQNLQNNTSLTMAIGEREVNFKHADCNMDGNINALDIDYLMEVLSPLAPADILVDKSAMIKLKATIDLTGVEPVIVDGEQYGLKLPFKISLSEVPINYTDSILGIVFTRSLTEDTSYSVLNTVFDFGESDLFHTGIEMIRDKTGQLNKIPAEVLCRQRFWSSSNLPSPNSCSGTIFKPLDVGLFQLSGSKRPPFSNARLGTCTVTLIDILRSTGEAMEPFTLIQHILNAKLLIVENGKIITRGIQCNTDLTVANFGNHCNSTPKPSMRDGKGDPGIDAVVPDVKGWASPDIWIRHLMDGLATSQNPVPGADELVYARVFNHGCTPLENVTVKVFWTKANTAATWPFDVDTTLGGIACTITIPTIPPWKSAMGFATWHVPNLPSNLPHSKPLLTLVGFATNGTTYELSPGALAYQVLRIQNVAALSKMTLLDAYGERDTAALVLKNPTASYTQAKLTLTQIEGPSDLSVSNFGNLELINLLPLITLDQRENMSHISDGVYRLDANVQDGFVDQIPLDNTTIAPEIGIRFTPNQTPTNAGGPIHYRYKLTMSIGSISYNSSIFEITIPGI
jgi:hypothetical protein